MMNNEDSNQGTSAPLIDVVLYLRGPLLDPDLVTLMLGVKGNKAHKKGAKWHTSTNKEVTSNIGLWTLDAERKSHSLSDHISSLRNKLAFSKCAPLQIEGVEEAEISIFIALGADNEGDGDYSSYLSREDLSWLSSLGVVVTFKLTHSS